MRPVFFATLVAAILVAQPVVANDDKPSRDTFESLYKDYRDAFARRDRVRIYALTTPDFYTVGVDGRRTARDEVIARSFASNALPPRQNRNTTLLKIRVGKHNAAVRQLYVADLVKEDADQSAVAPQLSVISDDVWRRMQNGWQLASSKTRLAEVAINGVVIASTRNQ
jgi:ketosteroid isomerase-like protein